MKATYLQQQKTRQTRLISTVSKPITIVVVFIVVVVFVQKH